MAGIYLGLCEPSLSKIRNLSISAYLMPVLNAPPNAGSSWLIYLAPNVLHTPSVSSRGSAVSITRISYSSPVFFTLSMICGNRTLRFSSSLYASRITLIPMFFLHVICSFETILPYLSSFEKFFSHLSGTITSCPPIHRPRYETALFRLSLKCPKLVHKKVDRNRNDQADQRCHKFGNTKNPNPYISQYVIQNDPRKSVREVTF